MSFSLHFPCWDFCIFNWILFMCEYWKYEQRERCWKSDSYNFCAWRIIFIRFLCRTTWTHINVRLQHYCRTTWDYIVVQHEFIIKHYYYSLMRKVVKWESFLCWNLFLESYIDKKQVSKIYKEIFTMKKDIRFSLIPILGWLMGLIQASIETNH